MSNFHYFHCRNYKGKVARTLSRSLVSSSLFNKDTFKVAIIEDAINKDAIGQILCISNSQRYSIGNPQMSQCD